jgi:hypothetical protein
MDRSIPAAVPAQTLRPARDSAKRLDRRQKPPACRHFGGNLRHLSCERGKNSGKISENSSKNGGNWRFFEGQSAISTPVYAKWSKANPTDMLGLTSASRTASRDLLTANSKTERHFFGCDWDPPVSDCLDMRVVQSEWERRDEPTHGSIYPMNSTWIIDLPPTPSAP